MSIIISLILGTLTVGMLAVSFMEFGYHCNSYFLGNLFDFGFGNGVRNKIAESIALDGGTKQEIYVQHIAISPWCLFHYLYCFSYAHLLMGQC